MKQLLFATAFAGLLIVQSPTASAQSGNWVTKTANLQPSPNASSAVIGGDWYVVGYGSLQKYDPLTDTWSVKTPPPFAACYTSSASLGNKLYLIGGALGCDDNSTTSSILTYDPAADIWSSGPSMSIPRTGVASAAINGKLYIVGGNAGYPYNALHKLEIYDSVSAQWSIGAPIPQAVSGAIGAAINGKFYVVGGASINETYPLNIVQIYDPLADTWTAGPPMSAGRFFGAGAIIDGKLFVVGGYDETIQVNTSLDVYDPAANSWTLGPSPTFPRVYSTAAVINSTLYVTDGIDSDGSPDGALEAFVPAAPNFSFAGFFPPINGADASGGSFASPSRTFKMGSTIPVKFTIALNAAPISTGLQSLEAIKYSDATTAASPIDAAPQGAPTAGSSFRFADNQWLFNLDTKGAGMSTGTWLLRARLSDTSTHTVWIQLK